MNRTDPTLPRSVGARVRRELLHLLAATGQLWRVNFSVTATLAGRRFRIPVRYGQGPQNLALLEPGVFAALKHTLSLRSGAVLDVGVNVGQTLLKIKALDWPRTYVGCEINPRCCEYVDALIAANRFPACTLVPAGLSDRNGVTSLYLRRTVDMDPSATMITEVVDNLDDLRPQCATVCCGDDVLEALRIEHVAVIKIDTEGAELEVLRGLARTVSRCRPFIICEILPVGDVAEAVGRVRLTRQRALEALLADWSYLLFRLHADGRPEPIADVGIHRDLALTNYLAVPASEREAIASVFSLRTT